MYLLKTQRQAHRLTIMYKITNNLMDINKDKSLPGAHTHNACNSHNSKFITFHTNNNSYKHSFFPHTIRNWNRLPQNANAFTDTEQTHYITSTFTTTNTATYTLILFPNPSNQPCICMICNYQHPVYYLLRLRLRS